MTVNYADKYQQAISEAFYPDNLYTSDLWNSPSNSTLTFDGAKHIKVPRLTIESGMKNRTRRQVTVPEANYSNDWDSYELTHDRYWSTLVDPLDVDETNMVVSMANITRQFNLDQKMPEMDRYMFSRLYDQKNTLDGGKGITSDALDAKNILQAFDNMMADMDEKAVPAQGRFLYVTPKIYAMLKSAEALNRTIVVGNGQNIQRSVYSLDSVTIVEVPQAYMQTKFDFTEGSKEVADAKIIQMMLIYNGAQIAPQKYAFAGFDQPSAATSGNYLYYENSYSDVFIIKPKSAGVQFVVADKPSASN